MKKILLLAILAFLSVLAVFAAGTSEADLAFFPTNSVNNQKVMIDLSGDLSSSASDFSFDFKNGSEGNNVIFRLRDTLYNGKTSGGSSSASASNTSLTDVTITSLDNWCFVNENNPTQVRPFTLDVFCLESRFDWGARNYSTATSSVKINENRATTLPKSNISLTYLTHDSSSYVIKAPNSDFSNNFGQFRAWNVRDFDVCIRLTGDYSGLEPGYYTTRLRIRANFTKYTSSNRSTPGSIDMEISIRGYIGIDYDEVSDSMTYSFSVLSAADTFSMNLGLTDDEGKGQDSYYDVANIKFMNVYTGTAQYGKNGSSNATENYAKGRFEIYISPTSAYNVGGKYQFRKLGTENQVSSFKNTIYYDLYVKNAAGTSYLSLTSNRAASAIQGTVSTDSNGGGINVVSGTNNTVYKFRPSFESKQVSSVGGTNQYVVTWKAELELYLKVSNDSKTVEGDISKTHNPGMYYSYLYVTLVTN